MSAELVVASVSFAASVLAILGWSATVWHRYAHRRTVRKFFGGNDLTVYLPLRRLAKRRAIDEADFQAAVQLVDGVIGTGVRTQFQFVTPEGGVDLAAEGLIVICGPKNSRDVASAMEADPCLRFIEDDGTFVIRDLENGRIYRSPSISENPMETSATSQEEYDEPVRREHSYRSQVCMPPDRRVSCIG